MGSSARLTAIAGTLLIAMPAALQAAEMTPIGQSRVVHAGADAFNFDQQIGDNELVTEEATDLGSFGVCLIASAQVDGAFASAVGTQQSHIEPTAIFAYGNMFANAQVDDGPNAASGGFSSSMMEMSFALDGDCGVELDIYLSVLQGASCSVQLWRDTVDGPVPHYEHHLNTPETTFDTTVQQFLTAGDYRLRANVQGGVWASDHDLAPPSAFAEYNVIMSIVDACTGDLNGDGVTDQADLGQLLSSYQLNDGGDIDGDGDTDQADLGLLLADWGCVQ